MSRNWKYIAVMDDGETRILKRCLALRTNDGKGAIEVCMAAKLMAGSLLTTEILDAKTNRKISDADLHKLGKEEEQKFFALSLQTGWRP